MELELRSCGAFEFECRDNEPPKLHGYAARFNSFSEDLDGFKEIIRPGAFQATIAGGADVRLLINHDGLPLARTASGTLKLTEDERGLKVEAQLDPTDPDTQRLVPKMRRGDLSQMSFAFRVSGKDGDFWRKEGEQLIRELHRVDLHDVSVVTYPAYQATSAAVRSLNTWKNEQAEREAKAWKDKAAMVLKLAGVKVGP